MKFKNFIFEKIEKLNIVEKKKKKNDATDYLVIKVLH